MLSAALILYSCASIGNPSGGPRDEKPPKPIRIFPPDGSLNFSGDRIDIDFDEIINVKDAFSKVTVSPPMKSPARVTSSGKRVSVNFTDTLSPFTTYSIDFSNSIEDNNEGNKLPSFTYTFSTGPDLDTLRISGMVLSARDLEPQKSILVGIHSSKADSAFRTLPFDRIAKTDDRGRFTIRGLAPGEYRLFALGDLNGDYKWDNPEETVAFSEILINPSAETISYTDTIYNLRTAEIDTIVKRQGTRFLPDDILLQSFNHDFKQQYIVKEERLDSIKISIFFNGKNKVMPKPIIIGQENLGDSWYIAEPSKNNDTITYWITDPKIASMDTIPLSVSYTAATRPHDEFQKTDTINLIYKVPKTFGNRKGGKIDKTLKRLNVSVKTDSKHDVFRPVTVEFGEPLVNHDINSLRIEEEVDSLWKSVDTSKLHIYFKNNPRHLTIDYPWKYGGTYRIESDSMAFQGISGLLSPPVSSQFTVKSEDDYAKLTFGIHGLPDSIPAIVELLSGDKPVRTADVKNNSAEFMYLAPGNYYARLFLDYNGNGEYDTGDYYLQRQPEDVYYYPKIIRVKKFWDMSQTWDINALPADRQKPEAIKKNKPDRNRNHRNNNQEEADEDEEEYFDPTANPFDPNSRKRRQRGEATIY